MKDRSSVGEAFDLPIENAGEVRRAAGELEIHGKTVIRSEKPAQKITEAVGDSGELTIEAWVRPAKIDQDGPARIVTISADTTNRNFTLGQERDAFDARLRTSRTSGNGIPSLPTGGKSLKTDMSHVVYTRDAKGQARIFINGKQAAAKTVAGDLNNWNGSYRLALGNELSGDRAWQGTYYLIAIYNRSLPAEDINRNFRAGAGTEAVRELLAQARERKNLQRFNQQVAPILVKHCFECHDAGTHKGDLNLAHRKAAFAGGESGKAILPGDAKNSSLWEQVDSGEMPKERDPLSTEEKLALKEWIDDGAIWPVEVLDPAVYRDGGVAAKIFVQRLTVIEYIETVRRTTGVDIDADARKLLPPDVRADGFTNTAYNLTVDLAHVEAFAELAKTIAQKMDAAKLVGWLTGGLDVNDINVDELIPKLGQWILRGPLEDREIETYRRIAKAVADSDGDNEEATRYVAEAMLQSPRFIYRIEPQQGDGTAQPVGPFVLASRMSYIVWGGPPDAELHRAAETGELAKADEIQRQAARMLKDPRAVSRSTQFLEQWLNLDRLDHLQRDEKHFPDWRPALAADMRAETIAYFQEVAWRQDRPLSDLFNAQLTFATAELAKHYGLKPIKERSGEVALYDLSSIPGRGGLLTQGSVLTIGGNEASMVARGLFVLHNVLRGEVKDPPPCVDTTPVPTKQGLTQRGIALQRIGNNACGGCHAKFEPLAFGLERFDGVGAYSERDHHNNPLRDDGEILFPGQAKSVPYKSSAELMDVLAASDRASETLTWKITQFALGRPLLAADAAAVATIHADAKAKGGSYADVVTAILLSDLVRKTRTEP